MLLCHSMVFFARLHLALSTHSAILVHNCTIQCTQTECSANTIVSVCCLNCVLLHHSLHKFSLRIEQIPLPEQLPFSVQLLSQYMQCILMNKFMFNLHLRGPSTTVWTKFYPILTTYPPQLDNLYNTPYPSFTLPNVDFLLTTYLPLLVQVGIFLDC